MEWIAVADRYPDNKQYAFVTDGRGIALAQWDAWPSQPPGWWNAVGFDGRDLEMDFKPTHWAPFEMPQLPTASGSS